MLITKSQIEELLNYRYDGVPVVSVYLSIFPSGSNEGDHVAAIKSLVHRSKEKLNGTSFKEEEIEAIHREFEKLIDYVENLKNPGFKGLALFSRVNNGFFQVYELDDPVKDNLIVDKYPYIRPLFAILRMYRRAIVLIFRQDKLRVFEVFGSRIKEEIDLFTRLRYDMRGNDYIFINEKKIQHRKESEYHKFLREASNEVLELFMKRGANYILLGGYKQVAEDFYKHMHSYLKDRFAGYLDLPFGAQEKEVLEKTRLVIAQKVEEEDRKVVEKIKEELSKNGDACCGIDDVLKHLMCGAISLLAVEEGYTMPGYMDSKNGFLYVSRDQASGAGDSIIEVSDIINEAIDEAMHQGAEIRIVRNKELMEGLEHIAALLRFKVQ
ncbi:MAG: hypothetical protein DRP54_04380 [Spirochaetes bacterium]|nr:MAG: hypothetical protein DRP54_04380 [Spirochaetota bacterium]